MSRNRIAALVLLASAALAAAGVAAAHSRRSQSTQAAAATFAAGSVSHDRSTTCTGGDGTYRETVATYEGTSSSGDSRLSGSLAIRAHSVVDTTTGLGWVEGSFRVRGTDGGVHGTLRAAVAGGKAVGTVAGAAGGPQGKLVASLSATFAQDGGFGSGTLGAGSSGGAGVVFQRGTCTRAKPARTLYVAPLGFRAEHGIGARARGSLALDVTRDSSGAITAANAVFYVNYRFGGSVTITGLALRQGTTKAPGPVVADAGVGTFSDADGNGNLTKQVGISGTTAQALLANPRGYYAELASASATLRAQLGGFGRR